jgi:hypothetical protein
MKSQQENTEPRAPLNAALACSLLFEAQWRPASVPAR